MRHVFVRLWQVLGNERGEVALGADPAADGGADGAPAADPAVGGAGGAPAPVAEPEFDLGEGVGKVKRADILGWQKSHGAYEGMKPLRDLDEFLSREENGTLAEAITLLIGHADKSKHQQVMDLLSGKLNLNGGGPPAPPVPEDWEKELDLTDPSVKGLAGVVKALRAELSGLKTSHDGLTKSRDEEGKQRAAALAEARVKSQLDQVWGSEKFSELMGRVHPDEAKEVETELRNRLLYAVLQSGGKVPMAQVAKTLHGRTAKLIDGIIKAYEASRAKQPPAGGGGGPVGTPGPAATEETLHQRVTERLGA